MMRDVIAEFKALRLHGMAATWSDLTEQNQGELEGSRWLIEQMLLAETTDRATRSVSHQMSALSGLSAPGWHRYLSTSLRPTRLRKERAKWRGLLLGRKHYFQVSPRVQTTAASISRSSVTEKSRRHSSRTSA